MAKMTIEWQLNNPIEVGFILQSALHYKLGSDNSAVFDEGDLPFFEGARLVCKAFDKQFGRELEKAAETEARNIIEAIQLHGQIRISRRMG